MINTVNDNSLMALKLMLVCQTLSPMPNSISKSLVLYISNNLLIKLPNFLLTIMHGTVQMQVDGLARVLALAFEYSRTNTDAENMSANKDNM